jgi:chromate transporter
VPLVTIAGEWSRIGITGFGGPSAHIALLRRLCVDERQWLPAREFEDGIAATSLLPGPTSTQLAIFCAWRLRGLAGALLGGVCFIAPGLVMILGLSSLFLARNPPLWVLGAELGAGAGVPAVAVSSALGLLPAAWRRLSGDATKQRMWIAYALVGAAAAATVGQFLVLALLGCGLLEVGRERRTGTPRSRRLAGGFPLFVVAPAVGGVASLAWVGFKVGALSYGGGFVIVPLMQHDAVSAYHWMTNAQFLNAVALGQITPGPVVQTVAVVGYAARGLRGGLLAAGVAFAPSFVFVTVGAPHFDRIRASDAVQAFLTGAGACAIGAIGGVAVPLSLEIGHLWQAGIAALAAVALLGLRRNVVIVLLSCGLLGVVAALAGGPTGTF